MEKVKGHSMMMNGRLTVSLLQAQAFKTTNQSHFTWTVRQEAYLGQLLLMYLAT